MTVKAVSLGIFLAFVFGAANAYLGMKAGQTVAATIPAAVNVGVGAVGGNALETLVLNSAVSGGTFTLTLNNVTTAPIAWNATAATLAANIQAALVLLAPQPVLQERMRGPDYWQD